MKKSGKKMNKKVNILTTLLALLAIALLVGLAAAQEATRSHPIEVDPGAEFDVSIDVSDLYFTPPQIELFQNSETAV